MLWLLFLSAILAIVAQSENTVTLKYYTVNNYETRNDFSFSCYGNGSSCEVYYSPTGTGCDVTSLLSIGTVLENQTMVLTSEIDLELGGGFCSDNQIGVYLLDANNFSVANLPRATEAGTKFHSVIYPYIEAAFYECTLSALAFPANVTIDKNGDMETSQIGSYELSEFSFTVAVSVTRFILKVDSDSPVILSCYGRSFPERLVTFQPISSEPLLISADTTSSVISWIISNCSTNEVITDFSKVSVTYVNYTGQNCTIFADNTASDAQAYFVHDQCSFYVEPLDNVCVSAGKQTKNFYLTSVGLPNPKLSRRFVNYPGVDDINLFSFSETTCVGFSSKYNKEEVLKLLWAGTQVYGNFSSGNWEGLNSFSDLIWMDCEDPTLVVVNEETERFPFLSAYQSEDLWQPFFDSVEEASNDVTPGNDTDVTPGNETDGTTGNDTDVTPSSDARSLVSCMNWFAFFGFSLFWLSID